ncbi:MAG: 50S ribosomal protein L15 [Elusimicrobiota bacterium]
MNLSQLTPNPGSRKPRRRIGRGEGSGRGQTATKGMKGQSSRSGENRMIGFEGGQIPLIRRLPKRGFNNYNFTIRYSVVNVGNLEERFKTGDKVTVDGLRSCGLVNETGAKVKILGRGSLTKKLSVEAHAISASAKQAIEKAGGQVTIITSGQAV